MKRVVINTLLSLVIAYAGWQAYQWEQDIFKQIAIGDVDDVSALVDTDPELLISLNEDRLTPLIYSIVQNELAVYHTLLKQGASPNHQIYTGGSAMSFAITATELEDLRFLELALAHGGNVDIHHTQRKRPLIFEALGSWNASKLDLLIKYGADINARNESGSTPMMSATMSKQYDVVIKLLDLGARFDLVDNNGADLQEIVEWGIEQIPTTAEKENMRREILERIAPDSKYLK